MGLTPPFESPPDRPGALGVYERVEGLVGEEQALLRVPAHEREHHHHRRLQELEAELDRLGQLLERRAGRRRGRG